MKDPVTLLAAEFDSEEDFRQAARRVRALGILRLEACSPYEVRGLAGDLQLPRSPLPRIALAGGLTGAVIGYLVQWYVNAVDYPLNAGGRPANAVPSFVFVTFETTVLFAAIAIFVGIFVVLRLPRYYHPAWTIAGFERVSADRFWLVVDTRDPHFERGGCVAAFTPGAIRIVDVEAAE